MRKGLFINQRKAACSIYESGLMIYNTLKSNPTLELDYVETTPAYAATQIYDFCVINYHYITLPFTKSGISKLPGLKIGINLEVSSNNSLSYMSGDLFDAYMIIDPTKTRENNLFPFPRPLEVVSNLREILDDKKIVVGSFGFYNGNNDKRFDEIIKHFNETKEECIIRFNFPEATYMSNNLNFVKNYASDLKSMSKSNIDLRVTYDYMSKEDLIRWCSEHHVNIFPYYRKIPGLAAVTDQAVSSGRALIVTECDTFRHLHKYISYYPQQSYNALMASTIDGVRQMQIDWSPEKFNEIFNELLKEKGVTNWAV